MCVSSLCCFDPKAVEKVQSLIKEHAPASKLRWVPKENLHLTLHFFGGALIKGRIAHLLLTA